MTVLLPPNGELFFLPNATLGAGPRVGTLPARRSVALATLAGDTGLAWGHPADATTAGNSVRHACLASFMAAAQLLQREPARHHDLLSQREASHRSSFPETACTLAGHPLPVLSFLQAGRVQARGFGPAVGDRMRQHPISAWFSGVPLILYGGRAACTATFLELAYAATGRRLPDVAAVNESLCQHRYRNGLYRGVTDTSGRTLFVAVKGPSAPSSSFNPAGYYFRLSSAHFVSVVPVAGADQSVLRLRATRQAPDGPSRSPCDSRPTVAGRSPPGRTAGPGLYVRLDAAG
jgi:hypothetical protein